MKIIIDERETGLYEKCHSIITQSNKTDVQLFKQVLALGDILIQTDDNKDVLLIERKTFADLNASIRDGRYEEQSYRLTHSSGIPLHNIVYLLEGMISQVKDKKIMYSAMTSLYYFKGFSTIRTMNMQESAEWIVWTTDKIQRDLHKGKIPSHIKIQQSISREPETKQCSPFPVLDESNPEMKTNDENKEIYINTNIIEETNNIEIKREPETNTETKTELKQEQEIIKNEIIYNATPAPYCTVVKQIKKENITPENIGEIILCQIPSVNSASAIAIMKGFSSFPKLIKHMQENPEMLNSIYIETNGKKRKLGKNVIDNIKRYLL